MVNLKGMLKTNKINDEFNKYAKSLMTFLCKNGYSEKPYPKVILHKEKQDGVFIKTGYYEPSANEIHLYIYGRHIKDILRSLAHEMIHHKQNIDGKLREGAYDGQRITDDNKLVKLEKDAYLNGNIGFRSWTELYTR